MLSNLNFGTLLTYSPKGASEKAIKSRKIVGGIKNGNIDISKRVAEHIKKNPVLLSMFDNALLVPVPRSSPIANTSLFPTQVICDTLYQEGLGIGVNTLLTRIKSVKKSSLCITADERPTVTDHYNTIASTPLMIPPKKIVIIDDVLTLGRTTMAAASRLSEAFPDTEILVFAVMRTRSFKDDNILVSPETGTMQYNPNSDKVRMPN